MKIVRVLEYNKEFILNREVRPEYLRVLCEDGVILSWDGDYKQWETDEERYLRTREEEKKGRNFKK